MSWSGNGTERYKKNDYTTLRSTVYTLVTVAAVAVLVAVLLLPVLQIYGSSTVGCVAQEQVVGKIVFQEWP